MRFSHGTGRWSMYRRSKSGLYLPPNVKGYSEGGASLTRRAIRGMNSAMSGSPREDIDLNNYTLRQRGRILYMVSPIAASVINTNRTNIVGTGLTLRATIDRNVLGLTREQAREWEHRAEAEFALWANDRQACDALGVNNFYELQQVAVKSWLMTGDVFAVIQRAPRTKMQPYSMRIHLVEADRISTPGEFGGYAISGQAVGLIPPGYPGAGNAIYDGVEVDPSGKVVAYYVCSCYPLEILPHKPMEWTRVLVSGDRTGMPNILQMSECERPDQYRGVPLLAQAVEPILQMRRYTDAELTAAIVQSYHTAWITTTADPNAIPFNETGPGDIGYEDEISDDESEYEMGPGTVFHLKEGEEIKFGNPNVPTTGYDAFMKSNLRMVGAGMDIAYDQFMKEYDSSYSAARAAQQDSWRGFLMRRQWAVNDFCIPVYQSFLSEAVATGRLNAPGFFTDPLLRKAWCGCKWVGPSQVSLDPLKEVSAAVMQIQHGIKTHSQVTREMGGGEWLDNMEQLAEEMEILKAAGLTPQIPQEGDGTDGSEDTTPVGSEEGR